MSGVSCEQAAAMAIDSNRMRNGGKGRLESSAKFLATHVQIDTARFLRLVFWVSLQRQMQEDLFTVLVSVVR